VDRESREYVVALLGLEDDSEEGQIWAANIIRWADNSPFSFKPELVPYPRDAVEAAWKLARDISDGGSDSAGAGVISHAPTGPPSVSE
jgi:hypothetical protein